MSFRRLPTEDGGDKTRKLFFENEQWFTTAEAANYLRISKRFLLNMTSQGRVKYFKLGRSNRYLKKDLQELLLDQARGRNNGN